MKSKIVLLVALMIIPIAYSIAQNNKLLDEKNGFKWFKFGESFETMSKDLEFEFEMDTKEKIYQYKGSEIKDILGVSFDEFRLSFYKNKLVYIGMGFGKDYDRYTQILDNLEIAFGKPDLIVTTFDNHPTFFSASVWRGSNVELKVFRYNYSHEDESIKGAIVLEFEIKDKQKKILLDGF